MKNVEPTFNSKMKINSLDNHVLFHCVPKFKWKQKEESFKVKPQRTTKLEQKHDISLTLHHKA